MKRKQAFTLFTEAGLSSSRSSTGPRERWSVRIAGEYRAVCRRDGAIASPVSLFRTGIRQSFGKEF